MLSSNISSTCPHKMVNFSPLTADLTSVGKFGAPQQILAGFASWLHCCSAVAHQRPTKLCAIFGCLLGWYTIYTFLGAFAPDEILKNSLCVQVLRSHILAALLHGTPAAGLSQTLRRGTRNGISELLQRAPPIFSWAAITFGIGPHSS